MDRQAAAPRSRRKTPSFSSSLLDAIYHSIDEQSQRVAKEGQGQDIVVRSRRNNGTHVEEEIESLRRAIMVEKWMENYAAARPHHLSSNSGSSTDSSAFSSSETESSSASRSSKHGGQTRLSLPGKTKQALASADATPKREGRFTRTKSRAMKIYGDLKKVKEPSSPGGRIASFLNSIFSPRNVVKKNQGLEDDFHPVRKSRSMKDPSTSTSCLSKNRSSSGTKSKRSVRFCPVNIILDQDSQPCGHKNIYNDNNGEFPVIGSHFIKKNMSSFRLGEAKNPRRHEFREFYENESDMDDRSCASSDLFELENIVGARAMYEEELPVYGTTSVAMNQAIANHQLF